MAGARRIDRGSGAGVGGEPQRVAALGEGVPSGARQCVSWERETALVRRPDRRVGAQGRPADVGDRFFAGVLAAHRGAADATGTDWKSAVYRKVKEEMKTDRGLAIARMVELGGVSRASFYRNDEDDAPQPDRDMDLRDAIQRIALEWPSYGRPRMTAALRRQGWMVNPKRVYRLLREDNLLCIRKRKFLVTTVSNHRRRVYPNLARQMVLPGLNQPSLPPLTSSRPH